MKRIVMKEWSAERLSHTALYALMGIIALMFALFYLVGYDHPYDENPDLNAPLLTGALVSFSLLFIVATAAVWLAALFVGLRKHSREDSMVNGIKASRLSWSVAATTAALLAITFALGSTSSLSINGATFDSAFWLRVADMFINTILAMLLLAVAAVIYGATRYLRGKAKKC